jgi:FkbH-like protein
METIKLVIWDLDETFWGGTLSEGGIQYRPENHAIVLELSRRGVINSICSKNDFEAARKVLVEHGLWDYFVFPKIDWNPKGEMIARTLDEMSLRAANVLFIDDNPQNLEEAKFYSPRIQVATPDALPTLLNESAVAGKADPELSRLKQYQLLQKKTGDRREFESSNENFLRQCAIQVEIRRDCEAVFDRLLEMIERTNQLNFTKKHLDRGQLRELISNPACECAYLKVHDRYGDYGIAGFYALHARRLEQFLFSCRILNMGVERWIYNRLGRPELMIVGEVSDDPTTLPVPDWIHLAESEQSNRGASSVANGMHPRVLLKGGCDLDQVIDFLGRQGGAIEGEFNYVTRDGAPVHVEHSEILRRCGSDLPAQYAEAFAKLPFLDETSYQTKFLSGDYDVYVFSTLMDMDSGLYRYGTTDWMVPFGDFTVDITDESNWEWQMERHPYLDRDFLDWFRRHFSFEGGLSETAFRDNLCWLCDRIPAHKQLILLNGAEISLAHYHEHQRDEHHRRMNAVLEEVIQQYPHVDLCDVRQFAKTSGDVRNNIRHYRRGVYYQIAGELRILIARRWSLKSNIVANLLHGSWAYARVIARGAIWATVKRIRGTPAVRPNNPRALVDRP